MRRRTKAGGAHIRKLSPAKFRPRRAPDPRLHHAGQRRSQPVVRPAGDYDVSCDDTQLEINFYCQEHWK